MQGIMLAIPAIKISVHQYHLLLKRYLLQTLTYCPQHLLKWNMNQSTVKEKLCELIRTCSSWFRSACLSERFELHHRCKIWENSDLLLVIRPRLCILFILALLWFLLSCISIFWQLCEVGYACTQISLSIVDTITICNSSHWGIHPVLLWWKSWSLKGESLIRFPQC